MITREQIYNYLEKVAAADPWAAGGVLPTHPTKYKPVMSGGKMVSSAPQAAPDYSRGVPGALSASYANALGTARPMPNLVTRQPHPNGPTKNYYARAETGWGRALDHAEAKLTGSTNPNYSLLPNK